MAAFQVGKAGDEASQADSWRRLRVLLVVDSWLGSRSGETIDKKAPFRRGEIREFTRETAALLGHPLYYPSPQETLNTSVILCKSSCPTSSTAHDESLCLYLDILRRWGEQGEILFA